MDASDFELFCLVNGVNFDRIKPRHTEIDSTPLHSDERHPMELAVEKQAMAQLGPGTNAALEHFWKHAIAEPVDPEAGRPNTFCKEVPTLPGRPTEQQDEILELAKRHLREGLALQRIRGDVALPVNPGRFGIERSGDTLQKNTVALPPASTRSEPSIEQANRRTTVNAEPANPRSESKSRLRARLEHIHQIFVNAGATSDDLRELAERLAELLESELWNTVQQAVDLSSDGVLSH